MWLYLVAHTLVCVVREQEWDFGTCSSWVSRLRMASYYLCKGSSVCIELADSRIPYSLNWCCTCIRQVSSVHLLGLYLLPFFLESWLGSRTVLRLSRSDHYCWRGYCFVWRIFSKSYQEYGKGLSPEPDLPSCFFKNSCLFTTFLELCNSLLGSTAVRFRCMTAGVVLTVHRLRPHKLQGFSVGEICFQLRAGYLCTCTSCPLPSLLPLIFFGFVSVYPSWPPYQLL